MDRETGKYNLTVSPFSLVAVLNDLHKGRDTSKKWSAVIDFSAILMTLGSLTGLVPSECGFSGRDDSVPDR
jgi:hypothetical protein